MPERPRYIMTRPDEVRSMVNCFHKVYYDSCMTWFNFIVETGSAWRVSTGFAV